MAPHSRSLPEIFFPKRALNRKKSFKNLVTGLFARQKNIENYFNKNLEKDFTTFEKNENKNVFSHI